MPIVSITFQLLCGERSREIMRQGNVCGFFFNLMNVNALRIFLYQVKNIFFLLQN